jgi:hypothetical protein
LNLINIDGHHTVIAERRAEDVVIPVAVAAGVGWLLLFFVLLALPPASQPSPPTWPRAAGSG